MADDAAPPNDDTLGGIQNAGPPIDDKTPAATKKAEPKKEGDSRQPPPADAEGDQELPPNQVAESLRVALGLKALDPHLSEMLRTAQLRLTKDQTGLLIDMPQNEHSLHCGKMKDGTEFIGMLNKKMIVDEHDAKVMIGLAKARGWKNINVQGTDAERDRLWLEAQRQGLNVTNYVPDPNSEVAKAWLAEPKQSVTEAKEEDFHVKTMQLLQGKATAATDKDVKAGLEDTLKKFQEGVFTGTADTFKQLSEMLSDKNEARAGYNLAAEFLNKAEPKLALAKLDAPVATATAATPAAETKAPETKAPAPRPEPHLL
ncbi:MAG: hypothetical protein EPN97_15385 [Alphaproteobacteria bacterium]|nr:MAG: hypothetical protein EPN97_15385 [Alphaproteobacteria bacterium]